MPSHPTITRRNARSRPRRGATATEFAVVAPLFFLLLAGIIEFGQAFRIQHMLSNACRRGARAAVVAGTTVTDVETRVTEHCVDTIGVNAEDVQVKVAVNGDASFPLWRASRGDEVSVTAGIPFNKAGVGFYANMFSNKILTATCILEHE